MLTKSIELTNEQKVYKLRRRWKNWKKSRNRFLNSLPKTQRKEIAHNRLARYGSPIMLNVPPIFSTSEDIETVLNFINKCKTVHNPYKQILFFNFEGVKEVNAGAIALILPVVNDFTDLNVKISGNKPKNEKAKKVFEDSGFLEFMYSSEGKFISCKSKILVKGKNQTETEKTAEELRKAMKTVFSTAMFNPQIQGAIIEMQANSLNHAFPEDGDNTNFFFQSFKKNKPWYLSPYHDFENKKVYFSFIDNGIGILKTINRRIYHKAFELLDSKEILQNAFEGKYGSSTKLNQRGIGLPKIREAFDKNSIRNFKFVTNNYLYDFTTKTGTKLINGFDGTFYFWILDETCEYGNAKNQQGLH